MCLKWLYSKFVETHSLLWLYILEAHASQLRRQRTSHFVLNHAANRKQPDERNLHDAFADVSRFFKAGWQNYRTAAELRTEVYEGNLMPNSPQLRCYWSFWQSSRLMLRKEYFVRFAFVKNVISGLSGLDWCLIIQIIQFVKIRSFNIDNIGYLILDR